jgi:hypothetical protein
MKFVPKTDDEIATDGLLPDGVYGFEVAEAEDTISKKGNDMIHVKLRVYDPAGGFKLVDDYLLESVLYKVKHIADVTGLADQYARGEFGADDLIGKSGHVKIGNQKQEGYSPKNVVKDYVVPKDGSTPAPKPRAKAATADDPFGDDEVPF